MLMDISGIDLFNQSDAWISLYDLFDQIVGMPKLDSDAHGYQWY